MTIFASSAVRRAVPSISRAPLLLTLCCGAAFACLAVLSLARYDAYTIGMLDLGNISQAIHSAWRGEPLVYTSPAGNISRLAGHVELIYFALALLLRLWPDPRVLLMAQAALCVSGALPVYGMARRRFPPPLALRFALGYLLLPTAVAAVLFDVHGDTLAMPLLLWMLGALDARRWRLFWLFLALSLLCKFYIVAPVFALGATLLARRTTSLDLGDLPRRRRLGMAICAAAALYGAIVMLGVRPAFASAASGADKHYLSYYFGALTTLGPLDLLERLVNVAVVLLPGALLWWRARWTAFPALAIVLPAVISTGPGASYAWSYHHYAAAVPFLVAGAIVGAARQRDRATPLWRRQQTARTASALFCGTALIFHIGLNNTPLGLPFWRARLGSQADLASYQRTSRDALKDQWLAANAPADQPLAVSNFLAPHLTDRSMLFLVRYPDEPDAARLRQHIAQVNTALPDALFDFVQPTGNGYSGGVTYDLDAIRQLLHAPDWSLIAARDGLLRFERHVAPDRALRQSIRPTTDAAVTSTRFGDAIELIHSTIEPMGRRRFRATFRWRAVRDLQSDPAYVAVSRLDGVPDARIVHLPSYALHPTTEWRVGQVWDEQFEIELPSELPAGAYTWRTGWYDTSQPYAALTDAQSRIGDEATVMSITLP